MKLSIMFFLLLPFIYNIKIRKDDNDSDDDILKSHNINGIPSKKIENSVYKEIDETEYEVNDMGYHSEYSPIEDDVIKIYKKRF